MCTAFVITKQKIKSIKWLNPGESFEIAVGQLIEDQIKNRTKFQP